LILICQWFNSADSLVCANRRDERERRIPVYYIRIVQEYRSTRLDNQKNRTRRRTATNRSSERPYIVQEDRIDRLESATKRTATSRSSERPCIIQDEKKYIVREDKKDEKKKKPKDKKPFHQFVFF
jgi:hypothetical protein